MKVGIVITHPTQFDVPVFRLGHDFIDVIYIDRVSLERYDPEIRISVTWHKDDLSGYSFNVIPSRKKMWWLLKKLRNEKYDLLITSGYFKPIYLFSLVAGKIFAKCNALRLDTVIYKNAVGLKKLKTRCLYFFLKIFVDHYFITSSLTKTFLRSNRIPDKKIGFFGYVIDNNFFTTNSQLSKCQEQQLRSNLHVEGNRKIFLCVSKHSEREAPFDTIQAFSLLNRDDTHLVLVGDGPLHQDIRQQANRLGVTNISFPGYVPFNQLPQYYGIAVVFIHDSHNEPWGVSVQEALASGLPVIASDRVGAAYDQIKNGKNGFMYPHGDINILKEKMEQVLTLDSSKIKSVNSEILSEFNYDRIVKAIRHAASCCT